MQVLGLPTHTVTSNGTVTQQNYYNIFQRSCVGIFLAILPNRFISLQQGGFLSMAKNVKNKSKKIRTYKVYEGIDRVTPCIRFQGKFLTKELGIHIGDRLEMTPLDNDTIVLRKLSAVEVAQLEASKQEKTLFKQLKTMFPRTKKSALSMMIAENRATYSVSDEIANHPERYSQA